MLSNTKDNHGWVMIIYHVPSTPSTSRVTIWKKVKELGAYLLQQSVYILPNLPRLREPLNQLKAQIHHLGGDSKIIEIASLGDDQEPEVIAGFNASRAEEYTEVIKACNELSNEIDEESRTEDFHYADLEENEKHLQRVKELLESVRGRDYFASPLQAKAVALMDGCQRKFDTFSHEVFARENIVDEKRIINDPTIKLREYGSAKKKEIVDRIAKLATDLETGVLQIESKKVGEIPDNLELRWEFREEKNQKSLVIEVIWDSHPKGKKSG
jgi:hypothetical protein